MPLFSRLFEIPFFENLLPDRLKPVKDEYISDQYSQSLFLETEKLIEDIIQLSEMERINRIFKRKTPQVKILLKIKKKRMRLDFSDQKGAEAPIKKRIIIDIYRKIYKSNNGVGKLVEATIYYTYQGQSFVRSVKRSPYLQSIFYKLDMLDDALTGRLVKHNEHEIRPQVTNHPLSEKQEEIRNLVVEMKRISKHNHSLAVDPIIENRLGRIIQHIEKITPDFHLLDIEDRHMLKRVLREDLPNLLHSFVSLTPQQQLEQKENVFVAISRIELKILAIIDQMEKMKLDRMEHLLRLNKVRYDD
ncbi:hypothetical protein AWH56_024490 [Anaerobacillus isosaccharinicus]|uniref:Uncharacterized protein n=1 Tax=Anaerobacillus isosaccharinicus TaxID=1532552 RepID=A0A1S2MDD8_9BACI|nr:hypothetical protein [Anaerobacillus isosaccharinicus]MBA5585936.1 hypothetical protein [Anaerobacillus isosaccharinicus]QOY35777.1 hypothetical protein AWH56_024490 [Anaerobacillus isosaccharinicus]